MGCTQFADMGCLQIIDLGKSSMGLERAGGRVVRRALFVLGTLKQANRTLFSLLTLTDLGEELNGSGESRCASDQNCSLHALHHRPEELRPLGVMRLESVALIADDDSKAAVTKENIHGESSPGPAA